MEQTQGKNSVCLNSFLFPFIEVKEPLNLININTFRVFFPKIESI